MAQFDHKYFLDYVTQNISQQHKSKVKNSIRYFLEWNTGKYESGDIEVDKKRFAYVLATAWHETGKLWEPVEEIGKGKRLPYGKPNRKGLVYFGRGDVQLTWERNYELFGKLLKIDLLNNPSLALDPIISCKILFVGTFRGLFTGKKIGDYINLTETDIINARRVINGVRKGEILPDKAEAIASYYEFFLKGVKVLDLSVT